ncbi:N-acetylmuramoyl-L-alanine amidase [Defluviimonas sp. SAOS-178_SWC]|uniref:N-acetylmuramoyl-L-alanine amidase n=1 Tax=Defluviimonas sp. SAOS-178_SWC TaxID=3121287 RepID=UPI003221C974
MGIRAIALHLLASFWIGSGVFADDLSALARLDPAASRVADDGAGIAIDLSISHAVPYRAFLLADPPRLVADFSVVEFGPSRPSALDRAERVRSLGWGPIRDGWSRLVAELDGPYRIESAEERVAETGEAEIRLRLVPEDVARFAAATAQGVPDAARWALPEPVVAEAPKRRQTGAEPLVVVLDPGHGGIDPGAEAGDVVEADVMLRFARELAEVLRRGGIKVLLTREEDVFVPLETRISVARAAKADVFLSLHADALAEGQATGATVYLLADEASDTASAQLAERHDRADLLAGVNLAGHDDVVAAVMMEMARTETQPRAARLAGALVAAIKASGGRMHRHPIQEAAFSVLKSPDIPSILLEVGFLSSDTDRRRLADPVWRASFQEAIRVALRNWAVEDAAEARLIRQ